MKQNLMSENNILSQQLKQMTHQPIAKGKRLAEMEMQLQAAEELELISPETLFKWENTLRREQSLVVLQVK